jgi:hypothetical protein
VVIPDGLGDSIEDELHCWMGCPSLQQDVAAAVTLNMSLEWKLRNDVEWSVDVESEVFVKSLLLRSLVLVKIEYLPLLMLSSVVTPNTYCLAFLILSSCDIKDLFVSPIDELIVLILEKLVPLIITGNDFHAIAIS